jgi:hypothetical protein
VVSDDLQVLLRWEAAGGVWEVLRRLPARVEVALLTCAGDEQMGRLESAEPDVLAHVDAQDAGGAGDLEAPSQV